MSRRAQRLAIFFMVVTTSLAACGEGEVGSDSGVDPIPPSVEVPALSVEAYEACQVLFDNALGGDEATLVYGGFATLLEVREWIESRPLANAIPGPVLRSKDSDIVAVCALNGEFPGLPAPPPDREWIWPNAVSYLIFPDGEMWPDFASQVEELPDPPEGVIDLRP